MLTCVILRDLSFSQRCFWGSSSSGTWSYVAEWVVTEFSKKTYLSTPWSRVLLDKLTGSQLDKKFPAFYGNRCFITAFTRARHLSLSWARSIQSTTPTHFLKIHLNIYACVFQVVSFPQASPPKPCVHLSSSPYVLRASSISFLSIRSPEVADH